jgi:hypothetical protein
MVLFVSAQASWRLSPGFLRKSKELEYASLVRG